MSGAGNGCYVDVAVVKKLLDIVSATQDEDVLRVLVWQNHEFCRLPRVLHLVTKIKELKVPNDWKYLWHVQKSKYWKDIASDINQYLVREIKVLKVPSDNNQSIESI